MLSKLPKRSISRHTHCWGIYNYIIIKAINAAVNLKAVRINVYVTIFLFLAVKLDRFLSWNWEKMYSKKIVKSILRCRKTINSMKNYFWKKQLYKEWFQAITRTTRGDDNNNTHLFSLQSVNKFKCFLLNFLIKHMVNASSCTAELWVHSWVFLAGLLSSRQLEEQFIEVTSALNAWEYATRSRYWIWLGKFSSYVIKKAFT